MKTIALIPRVAPPRDWLRQIHWLILSLVVAGLVQGCGGESPEDASSLKSAGITSAAIESDVAATDDAEMAADEASALMAQELHPDDLPIPAEEPGGDGIEKSLALGSTQLQEPAATARSTAYKTTLRDALRLADQASFGATDGMLLNIRKQGPAAWIASQMAQPASIYSSGGTGAIHQHTSKTKGFCDGKGDNCWRNNYSTTPLVWDFYRNATTRPDQLRQRVAFALQQIMVVSGVEISGTYGMRAYNNMLLSSALGNYRTILKRVTLSPVMGDYLDHVNNDKNAPNENFTRELLQLFSIGLCELNADGTLKSGTCIPTYNNDQVRDYAYALTGWTYPKGGKSPWGCWPKGTNCVYYRGDMVEAKTLHNPAARTLLSGVMLPEGHSAPQALEAVLDSIMRHPNTAPFVSRQLIQHLVTSNPSPAYVARVSAAFNSGRFRSFGRGVQGDMKATVAAILLDEEARTVTPSATAGRLREPVHFFTATIRSLKGKTDGDALGWWWGEELRQHVFRSPSVFNFYPPDYPVVGTSLVGPAFGIHNANAALQRMNFLNYLMFSNGSKPSTNVPNAVGTSVKLSAFLKEAKDPTMLVDRLSLLALGETLPTASRSAVIAAVAAVTEQSHGKDNYLTDRVRQAAYLVFASPQFQLIR